MNSLEKILESVVVIIQAVFGFLPPWCLVFTASAFVVVLALIVYKLTRG